MDDPAKLMRCVCLKGITLLQIFWCLVANEWNRFQSEKFLEQSVSKSVGGCGQNLQQRIVRLANPNSSKNTTMWTTSIVRNAQTYITNSRSKRTKTLNFQFLSQRSWTSQHTDPPQVTLKFSQSFLFSHIVSVFNCLPPFLTAILRSIAFFPACFMLEKKPIIMLTYPCPHPHTPPLVQCLIITIDTLYWAPRTRKNIFVIGHRHEAEMGSISFLREQGGNVWLQKSSKMTISLFWLCSWFYRRLNANLSRISPKHG